MFEGLNGQLIHNYIDLKTPASSIDRHLGQYRSCEAAAYWSMKVNFSFVLLPKPLKNLSLLKRDQIFSGTYF